MCGPHDFIARFNPGRQGVRTFRGHHVSFPIRPPSCPFSWPDWATRWLSVAGSRAKKPRSLPLGWVSSCGPARSPRYCPMREKCMTLWIESNRGLPVSAGPLLTFIDRHEDMVDNVNHHLSTMQVLSCVRREVRQRKFSQLLRFAARLLNVYGPSKSRARVPARAMNEILGRMANCPALPIALSLTRSLSPVRGRCVAAAQ